MPKEYTFPPKLKLICDHLNAVRALDDYVNGVGLKKDMQGFSNHIQRDLDRTVFRPAGWEDLYVAGGLLYSSPEPKSKWSVVRGDAIAIEIYPAWPVNDDEPYVNLYVPLNWKKRQPFVDKLKTKRPPGFQHVSEGDFAEEDAIFKYVPYADHVGADGVFDLAGLTDAFRAAAKALVEMKGTIDDLLERLA